MKLKIKFEEEFMMENDKELKTLLTIAGIVIVAPIIWNAAVTIGCFGYAGIANTVNKVKFNKKMKKGLKDGSIMVIDGEYYEVQPEEEA
jgi:hypothetical protein